LTLVLVPYIVASVLKKFIPHKPGQTAPAVDGILTVGENADVRGEVKSKTVIVKGKVHGNITVQERCELHSRSQLIGDLKAARLVIEEGATFVGKSEVTPNKNLVKDFGAPAPHKEEPQKVGAPR
jgi:cytoskeletal protein CcmA (bactofilin family)